MFAIEVKMKDLTQVQKLFLTAILVIVAAILLSDVAQEVSKNASTPHLLGEGFAIVCVFVGLYFLWSKNVILSAQLEKLDVELKAAQEEAKHWRAANASHIEGLSLAIDRQLSQWGLTISEKEIALLLLKGFSLKEVAELRHTSERTVRQQAVTIYSKSGLGGRNELAAFFLEDLMVPK